MINQLNQKIRKKRYPPMAPKKKKFHKKFKKKKLLTSHKIKKTLVSKQLFTSDKIISLQILNTHH